MLCRLYKLGGVRTVSRDSVCLHMKRTRPAGLPRGLIHLALLWPSARPSARRDGSRVGRPSPAQTEEHLLCSVLPSGQVPASPAWHVGLRAAEFLGTFSDTQCRPFWSLSSSSPGRFPGEKSSQHLSDPDLTHHCPGGVQAPILNVCWALRDTWLGSAHEADYSVHFRNIRPLNKYLGFL